MEFHYKKSYLVEQRQPKRKWNSTIKKFIYRRSIKSGSNVYLYRYLACFWKSVMLYILTVFGFMPNAQKWWLVYCYAMHSIINYYFAISNCLKVLLVRKENCCSGIWMCGVYQLHLMWLIHMALSRVCLKRHLKIWWFIYSIWVNVCQLSLLFAFMWLWSVMILLAEDWWANFAWVVR